MLFSSHQGFSATPEEQIKRLRWQIFVRAHVHAHGRACCPWTAAGWKTPSLGDWLDEQRSFVKDAGDGCPTNEGTMNKLYATWKKSEPNSRDGSGLVINGAHGRAPAKILGQDLCCPAVMEERHQDVRHHSRPEVMTGLFVLLSQRKYLRGASCRPTTCT